MACSIAMSALEAQQEQEQDQRQPTNPTLIENEDSQLPISKPRWKQKNTVETGNTVETEESAVHLDVNEDSQLPISKTQFCSQGNMVETEVSAVHLDANGPGIDSPEDEDRKRNPERHKLKKVTFVTVKQVESTTDTDLEKGVGDLDAKESGEAAHSVGDDAETVCRVCHLTSDGRSSSGDLIIIGCGCKEDLSIAHRQCAETWFKIRGNRICEICGEIARNVTGVGDAVFLEEWNDRDTDNSSGESPRCWRSRPLCNFLMACMVVAFILPWFFRVSMF